MNQRIVSTNLFRILVIIALVIPMTFGATSPASASFDSNEIITWGYNANGQYTTPSGLTDVIAIAAGSFHNLALRSDGTVVAWGENSHGQRDVPADLSGVVAIAAGDAHSLALKSDGTVVAWGYNNNGETDVPSSLTDVVAIYAGGLHSVARKSDGTFVGWGNNGYDQITFPPGLAEVVAFDVGLAHNLAIKPDGTVVAWGYNVFGQTDVPEGLTDVVAVAAGQNHSLALKSDGTVVAWGNNTYGQTDVPSGLTGVVAIAAGGTHSLALKNDGTVVGWGENSYGQSSPPSAVFGAVAIYAGYWHSLALVPQIAPQVVYDNFDDNFTDPSLWSIQLRDSGPTGSETNQRLEITLPANSAGDDFAAWYDSICQLRGDYDIQVDYELLTWPNASGVRLGLTDTHANMHRVSSGGQPNDYPGGPDLYMTLFDAGDHWITVGITPTSDPSGKLRLQRVGDTINTFYFANGVWMPVASNSDPAYAADTPFALGAWSADSVFAGQEVKIAFDNLMINAGELVCPPTTAPDLAITQVADQATVSTGDPMGYTITVTNNGDATANSVTLSDTLPVYTHFSWSVSGTDAAACVLTGGALSCDFGDMPPGAVKTIRLTAPEYEYHSKCFSPIITSTATVMASNQPVNKTATASVTVLCPYPYLDITAASNIVTAGDPVSYTVTIGNPWGDGSLKDVEAFVDIQKAPGTSWQITEVTPSSAASNCTFGQYGDYMELECLFDQIAPLEEVSVKLTSPTTSASCGTFGAYSGMWSSNSFSIKIKPNYITVNCPALLITKTADAGPFSAGDQIGFTIEVSNPYPVPAYGVTLTDTVPTIPMEWLIDQQVSPECSLDSGTWTCNIGTMAPNSTYNVHIFSSSSPSTCGRAVENTASVSDSSGRSSSASDSLVVNCPDLTVTNTAASETVNSGDPIRFDITVTNHGAGTAKDVALSDTLPTYTGLNWSVGGTDAASCTITTGVVSCNFGDMPPGAVKTIRLTSPTPNASATHPDCPTISNTATVMAYNQPEGRSATASVTVLCPRIWTGVWVDTPSVTAGDPISFTIHVGNIGEGIARDVLAETTLPENPGLSWSITNSIPDGAASNCYLSSGTPSYPHPELVCSFDQLAAGQEVAIIVTSPTTSGSCGALAAGGVVASSNGGQFKGKAGHITVSCTVGATVQPGEAATLALLNGRGQIEFPADLVSVPTTFTYTKQDAPSQPLGSNTFAGLSFTLDATDSAGNLVTSFPASYTIRLTYQDSDWQSAGIADESRLNLAYWDTANGQWMNVLPCEGCSLDPTQNRLVAVLNHLTEFALLAPTDTMPPSITLTKPAEGAVYLLGQAVNADYACQDETGGSGLASCVGNVPNGSPIDTSAIGAKTFTVEAADNTGNTVSVTHTYRVIYNFTGFTSPVDNPSIMNTAKAGQAIPLKWRITDANGNPVTTLTGATVTAASLSCPSAPTIDVIEEYATSNSGLQNLGDGYYQWNWKSPSAYANTCKTLKLNLGEGAGFEHLALFQFRK